MSARLASFATSAPSTASTLVTRPFSQYWASYRLLDGGPNVISPKSMSAPYLHFLLLTANDLCRGSPAGLPIRPVIFHYKQLSWVWLRLPFWVELGSCFGSSAKARLSAHAAPDSLGLVNHDNALLPE